MEDPDRAAQAKAAALEQPPVPAYTNPPMNIPAQIPQPYQQFQNPNYYYAQPQMQPQPQPYGYYQPQVQLNPVPPPQAQMQQPQQPNVNQLPVIDSKIQPSMSEKEAEERFDDTVICRCCHGGDFHFFDNKHFSHFLTY